MSVIVSYNINGIRAAIRKGLDLWITDLNADVICFQEIKANKEQFNIDLFNSLGYYSFVFPANKPGYSGVAIISKIKPDHVEYGCGIEEIDNEGRVIRADFKNFSVMSVYFPSGSSGDIRQAFKMKFLNLFQQYIDTLKQTKPNLVVSGDYNICHCSIDIHNPERNKNTSGFLPEERKWMTSFIDSGFIDSFRFFNKSPNKYSWWSYRANARNKNLGWRIDYNMVSKNLESKMISADILSSIKHSDHCPVLLKLAD